VHLGFSSRWIALGLAVAVLAAFWTLVVGQTESSVFGRVPLLDEVYYLDRAAEIADGALIPAEPFFMSPLYPYLVAAAGGGGGVPESRVYQGSDLRGLRLLQIVCWLGTLVLVRLLAAKVVPREWHGLSHLTGVWLPPVLFALYRPAAVYAMAVVLEVPLMFLVVLAVWLLWSQGNHPSRGSLARALAVGVVLGLAGLLRGTALLLVPLAMLGAWRGSGQKMTMLVIIAGVAAVLAPFVIKNSIDSDKIVTYSLNGGVNLYIGNGPDANGFYVAAVPGNWRTDPSGRAFLAERLGRSRFSLAQSDSIWAGEAWRQMRMVPGRTLLLMLKKIWLQWQGWEIDQLMPLAGWRVQVPVLAALVVPYALLVVLGVVGLSGGVARRGGWILIVALALLIVGQSFFFVVSRYRLVLVPLWAIASGVGAVKLYRQDRRLWLVAGMAAVVTVPWGLNQVRGSWAALAEANEALRWVNVGRAEDSTLALQRAEVLYRRSLAAEPARPASWLGLAGALSAQGDPEAEAAVLREGLKVAAPYPLQRALLAVALSQGNSSDALAVAQGILKHHPRDADALHNAAVILGRSGQRERALALAQRLRRSAPADPRGYIDTGVLLARNGHQSEARAAFRMGLRNCPDNADLLHNLAQLE